MSAGVDRSGARGTLFWVAGFAVIAAISATFLIRFALAQNVWIDESTQLSGITLSPWQLIRWLAGTDQGRFGVPGDRMPPLSYLLDWSWARLVSDAPSGLRLFHAAIACSGVAVLCTTVGKRFGWSTALVLAALLALSTRMVDAAVEIRAYPILIALTCLLLTQFLNIVLLEKSASGRSVLLFAFTGALTVYTHFFGSMAYFGLASGLLWNFRRDLRSLSLIAGASLLTLLSMVALKPIATAAGAISGAEQVPLTLSTLAFYAARLLAGSADMVRPWAAGAIFTGAILLLAFTAIALPLRTPARDEEANARTRAIGSVLIGLGVGVGATLVVGTLVHSFNALKPNYSFWTIPLIAFAIAAGWSQSSENLFWDRVGRHLAIALVVAGSAIASFGMTAHKDLYVHGPSRFIMDELAKVSGAVVIYDCDDWGWGYFPLRFFGRGALVQYRGTQAGFPQIDRIVDGARQPAPQGLDELDRSTKAIVLVVIRNDTYKDLRRYEHGSSTNLNLGSVGTALSKDPRWELDHVDERPGYYSARIWVWRRSLKFDANGAKLDAA